MEITFKLQIMNKANIAYIARRFSGMYSIYRENVMNYTD